MRIGIDARMYGAHFTGIGRYTFELIRHLAELDQKHDYVVFLRREAFDAFTPPGPRFTRVLADYSHYSFGEQTGFLRLLSAAKLDLMHFTHFNAPLFYRRPFVVTVHDLTLTFYPGKKMRDPLHRMAYHWVIRSVTRRARRIIAVSGHTKNDLVKTLHIPAGKIDVIYNGVSPDLGGAPASADTRSSLAQKFGLERPYFLYTGVWRDHKNLVGMIQAFARFSAGAGCGYDLVITGRPSDAYQEVPGAIRACGLEKQIHLVGLVPDGDLAALYRHAAAYVFPSFYEGFGMPPLEAMQAGTPVIASNAASIPEVCGKDNALYFNPTDIDDMAEKMQRIATDDLLRSQLIKNGFERARQFRWDAMAEKVLGVYNQILSYGIS